MRLTMIRFTVPLSLIAFLSFVTFGCTSQPLAPSALPTGSETPALVAPSATTPTARVSAAGGRPASGGVIYVTSQELFFDTIFLVDPLPFKGKFQLLEMGLMGPQTEFGPGDPGYLGGRWWEDLNSNGIQDPTDHYFLCPLLPPGRELP